MSELLPHERKDSDLPGQGEDPHEKIVKQFLGAENGISFVDPGESEHPESSDALGPLPEEKDAASGFIKEKEAKKPQRYTEEGEDIN